MAQTKLVELDNTYQKAILADIHRKKDPTQIEDDTSFFFIKLMFHISIRVGLLCYGNC